MFLCRGIWPGDLENYGDIGMAVFSKQQLRLFLLQSVALGTSIERALWPDVYTLTVSGHLVLLLPDKLELTRLGWQLVREGVSAFVVSELGLPYSDYRLGGFAKFAPHIALVSAWEHELLEDWMNNSQCDKPGWASISDLFAFRDTFCRMIEPHYNGLRFLSVCEKDEVSCMTFSQYPDGVKKIESDKAIAAYRELGEPFLRFWSNKVLYLVATNESKNWLRTTAIWTSDAVVGGVLVLD
jgi:hypothetical protein